ncbi:MAG TPA: hypothetical protein VMU85_21535, partial [Stellaceae bacterium]|nr:hypothetical protein [Stellaceae bacterium]
MFDLLESTQVERLVTVVGFLIFLPTLAVFLWTGYHVRIFGFAARSHARPPYQAGSGPFASLTSSWAAWAIPIGQLTPECQYHRRRSLTGMTVFLILATCF